MTHLILLAVEESKPPVESRVLAELLAVKKSRLAEESTVVADLLAVHKSTLTVGSTLRSLIPWRHRRVPNHGIYTIGAQLLYWQ